MEENDIKIWKRKEGVKQYADVPDNFLRKFAKKHPDSVRKFGKSKNCTLLFNVRDVLAAIENNDI